MKTFNSSNHRNDYDAIEEKGLSSDPSEDESSSADVHIPSALCSIAQILLYPCATLLGSVAITTFDTRHHVLRHVTAYIGWFFLTRSIQGTPNPLALVTCSILILSGSYVEGVMSRERMIAIFVGSSMLLWLPQISRYQPSKGSLHDVLKTMGHIERLCLTVAQLAIGVSFIIPRALNMVAIGPKVHSNFLASIGVGWTALILGVPSLIVAGFRLKKPIKFVHDRWAFPLLVSSVIPPLCFVLSLVISMSHTLFYPLSPRALQVLAVAWTFTVELVVICFFWTHCCSWPWRGYKLAESDPGSIASAVTFGYQVLYRNECEDSAYLNTLNIPPENGEGHQALLEEILNDVRFPFSNSILEAWQIRLLNAVEVVLIHFTAMLGSVVDSSIGVPCFASLYVYMGWFLIGLGLCEGIDVTAFVSTSLLIAWGGPFDGRIYIERFWAISCICNLLVSLPLFVNTRVVNLGQKPCRIRGDLRELALIRGALYLVAEYSWLSLLSFVLSPLALGFTGITSIFWDSIIPQPCPTIFLIIIVFMAAVPVLACLVYEKNDERERGKLQFGMGALGTTLSVGMRYLSTNGLLAQVIPPMDSAAYQLSTTVIMLCVEVLVITLHIWRRRRLHPENYRYNWWLTSSQLESVETDV